MNVEKFIETIKGYPFLYNTGHKLYKDVEKKTNTWKEIAEIFEFKSADTARIKWKNIRDSYVKYLRSLDPLIVDQTRYKKWPHAPQMEFLKPFLCAKRSIYGGNNSGKKEPDIRTIVYVPGEKLQKAKQRKEHLTHLTGVTKKKVIKNVIKGQITIPPLVKEEKNIIPSKEIPYSSSHEGDLNQYPAKAIKPAEFTPLELIFLGYARTLQTFPKHLQTTAKMMVSQVMTDIEMEFNQISDENAKIEFNGTKDSDIPHLAKVEAIFNESDEFQDKQDDIVDDDSAL